VNGAAMRGIPAAFKLITCIIPAGRGLELVRQLKGQGVASVHVHHARGVGTSSRRRRGVSYFAEREIIDVLVEAERADAIFEFIYRAADIGKPHAGMLLMEKAGRAAPLLLPDLPEEE
jgi:nitrogen regulatory protein P-II 1